jgi:nucleotide-binding universal stress UspA family protein
MPERRSNTLSIFPTKILLAIDGSKEATLAASTAIELAERTDSELHIVYVNSKTELSTPPGWKVFDADLPARLKQAAEEEARTKLNEEVQRVREAGGEVTGEHARLGRPDAEIVGLSEELSVGLIVIGSRGLGGVRRALIGSVSDSVVRHAHCPVLVVRNDKH